MQPKTQGRRVGRWSRSRQHMQNKAAANLDVLLQHMDKEVPDLEGVDHVLHLGQHQGAQTARYTPDRVQPREAE